MGCASIGECALSKSALHFSARGWPIIFTIAAIVWQAGVLVWREGRDERSGANVNNPGYPAFQLYEIWLNSLRLFHRLSEAKNGRTQGQLRSLDPPRLRHLGMTQFL